MQGGRGPRCDRYGLPLTTASASAAQLYVDGLDRHLAWSLGAEPCFERALAMDETFALAHAGLAVVRRFQGTPPAPERARPEPGHWPPARRGASSSTPRPSRRSSAAGPARALALLRAHLAEFPRDALMLQLATALLAASGTTDRREQLVGLLEGLASAYGDDWWFLGVSAYAYQEVDRLGPARRLAERSLARHPHNAGAAHALAHVFYETDDHAGGTAFLRAWLTEYASAAPYHCHLSWHQALAELVQGNVHAALLLYERTISPVVADAWTTLADAASLLWRVRLYGHDSDGLPWDPVCRLAADRFGPGQAFASAHAALAYAAAHDAEALERLLHGLQALARQGDALAVEVTLPLVQGIAAFGRDDYAEAAERLQAVDGGLLVRLGGTNAQREVFEETLLVALLRAGRLDQAEALLRHRLGRRPAARDLAWLADARAAPASA